MEKISDAKLIKATDKTHSLQDAYRYAVAYLSEKGIEDAGYDAMALLEAACGYSRNKYFMHRDEPMTKPQADKFFALAKKRGQRIPLQHILGEAWFYGRRFFVNNDVLIPRADTEILIEEALRYIKPESRVLDMCTGSGCIAITLSKESGAHVSATDISAAAIGVARDNAKRLDAPSSFIQSDMFNKIEEKFDVIVSNPPYIKSADIEFLQDEVKKHDPLMALDGGEDGLCFYRIIAGRAADFLLPCGRLILEIGYDQAEAVEALLKMSGFRDIQIIKDLNHLPRVVSAAI